jgi:hypothetical protein
VTSKDELLIPTSAAEVFHRFHKGERLRYGIIEEEGAETSSTKEVTDPQNRFMLLRRHRGQILLGVLLALVLLLQILGGSRLSRSDNLKPADTPKTSNLGNHTTNSDWPRFFHPQSPAVSGGPPHNLRLAFFGDSTCRHLFLMLTAFLHNGTMPANDDPPKPNLIEGGFATHRAYEEFIVRSYNSTLACNCYTPPGVFQPWGLNHLKRWQNIYYHDDKDNYITHITKQGSFEAHGHWDATQIYSNATYHRRVANTSATTTTYPPGYFLWASDWVQTIRYHIAKLRPKPKFLVINAGLWPHDLHNATILQQMRQALDEHDMVGIYKTTHKQLGDNSSLVAPYEQLACQVFHYCWNLSWTAQENDPADYQDKAHFRPTVNGKMTEQLLRLLQNITNDLTTT